ncbi:MAG: 50S ribosomal protein L11 methyltransferase, partial [Verrucomicrobia bacterium]|nr:50S ribosomal protein L11 methyltransferase [Verrucomicrobiota bacterium]
ERRRGTWDLLDLGTGSGILALAALHLGARSAHGLDSDPHAVRTARENARLNGLAPRRVRFSRADLLRDWQPDRTWPVITANLFSDLLIRLLPKVIAPALADDGYLILSGVLASQADEVLAAVADAGLTLRETKRRGRWRAFRLRR